MWILIINFLEKNLANINNLEQLENYRRTLTKFEKLIAKASDYTFFNDFYIETMSKLEHLSNVFENGGIETAPVPSVFSINSIFKKIRQLLHKKIEIGGQR